MTIVTYFGYNVNTQFASKVILLKEGRLIKKLVMHDLLERIDGPGCINTYKRRSTYGNRNTRRSMHNADQEVNS